MKTLGILAAVLILSLLALGLGRQLNWNLAGQPGPRGASFSLNTPRTASASLTLTAQEEQAVTRALASHGNVASATLHAERTPPSRHRVGPGTPWAAFSMQLTLDNGAILSSRVRQVPRERLKDALSECVAECMRAYGAQEALGRDVRRLSNI
ncbi:hypothetical protein [Desulfocurvus sp.]|jgi:hypothetical protein|uniref:hypothetical protein n=1 Tax=Desulfocurvus sp. TaxID=2871698 RepID=UPI0025C26AFB|nr:hypothetical protein [Desulfocurvus sp.]MCK9239110.1 hypothetical protein [Desulfocurvus sp.]